MFSEISTCRAWVSSNLHKYDEVPGKESCNNEIHCRYQSEAVSLTATGRMHHRAVFLRDPLEWLFFAYIDKCHNKMEEKHCEPNVVSSFFVMREYSLLNNSGHANPSTMVNSTNTSPCPITFASDPLRLFTLTSMTRHAQQTSTSRRAIPPWSTINVPQPVPWLLVIGNDNCKLDLVFLLPIVVK